jgi:hypothetical protein
MKANFDTYPVDLFCGLVRAPSKLTEVVDKRSTMQLLDMSPPDELRSLHDGNHLISFANHVSELIREPVKRVLCAGHEFFAVLGVGVFQKMIDDTFRFATWYVSDKNQQVTLVEIDSKYTPIIDFPRTSLWEELLKETFTNEAVARGLKKRQAKEWTKWAWQQIHEKVIAPVGYRRIRSRVRKGLILDVPVLSLLKSLGHGMHHQLPTVPEYNFAMRNMYALLELKVKAPLIARLATGLNLPDDWNNEPLKHIKQATRNLGITQQQWRVLASRDAPLMPLYECFVRDFVGTNVEDVAIDFIKLIRLMGIHDGLPTSAFRSVLSMIGTRANDPNSYGDALGSISPTIVHITRLIQSKKSPEHSEELENDLHNICSWVCDMKVLAFCKSQRRLGWNYLKREAHRYAESRELMLKAGDGWSVPVKQLSFDGYKAYAIQNGKQLWDESQAMNHCADLYWQVCKTGEVCIYSIQNKLNKRIGTLAVKKAAGRWDVLQLSGKANKSMGLEMNVVATVVTTMLNAMEVKAKQIQGIQISN